ncbi:MAG: DegT/DnrJ/EryC1/StrS family aminotransferase [Candidatus Sericytochromatia bacterium]
MFTEIEKLRPALTDLGFTLRDPWDVVDAFEQLLAKYAGSRYAVALDNCTNALFLCLKYLKASGEITVPARTYVSVPQTILHAGCQVRFRDEEWQGVYRLDPFPVIDGAARFRREMYVPGSFHCLSFHIKKILPIGKGGMILTDDAQARHWFRLARYEGRDLAVPYDQDLISMLGWNMYMPPEQAARGIALFLALGDDNPDCGGSSKYPDLRAMPLFAGV